MDVYIDIVLLINFISNFFLLYITSQIVKMKLKMKSYCLGAAVGSLYVIVLFYPSLSWLTTLPFKLLSAFVIVAITFRRKELLFLIKSTVIYILTSFLLAGVCLWMDINSKPFSILGYKIDCTYKELMLALMIIYIVTHRIVTFVMDRMDLSSLIYDVKIITKGSNLDIKAFLDTGNELREPVTNLPVMVVDRNSLRNIDSENYDKLLIPYEVISGRGGNLQGFKPEYIEIKRKGKAERREVIVAFGDVSFSGVKEYEALLSRGII